MTTTFDPVWEDGIYGQGKHLNRYPFDAVVSFVFRHAPRGRPRSEVRILEVGCGAANNLWFAAREGFDVSGIDGSDTAIRVARERFEAEGLPADLHVGDFTALPFADDRFDLVIDRGALTCVGLETGRRAVAEARRVLKPGGLFFFNPYSDRDSSARAGRSGDDGVTVEITEGLLVGVGQICFYGRRDVDAALRGFALKSVEHLELAELSGPRPLVHAHWRVIAQKVDR